MEIDGDPDDMDRVKKMEALATSKLEKISQDLKVIGRLAFRIDDILYCLKHCSRSLEDKGSTIAKLRKDVAESRDDKLGDGMAALVESLHHFDEIKKSTTQSLLERLDSICSDATLDSTLLDLSAVAANMKKVAVSVTNIPLHRLLVEGMKDMGETFENISSIAHQAAGAAPTRSGRSSTLPTAEITGYFVPKQSATRLSNSGRAVKSSYETEWTDESDLDVYSGKKKGKGRKDEDEDYWEDSPAATSNQPSKRTTSIDARLSSIVQNEDEEAQFEGDDNFFGKQTAASKRRTSSVKSKVKYTLSQDEPDAPVVLDISSSPAFVPPLRAKSAASSWSFMKPVHAAAATKAPAPPTLPDTTQHGALPRSTPSPEGDVITLDDSNEARSVAGAELESPQPPQVPPFGALQQQRDQENEMAEDTGSEGEEEMEVEAADEAEELDTQPQTGMDFENEQHNTQGLREDDTWRVETRDDQYFHDTAHEDGDDRDAAQYFPSSSQQDSQENEPRDPRGFESPQSSEDDSDEYETNARTRSTPTAAGSATEASSLAHGCIRPDEASTQVGVGSPGGPRRRGEKVTPKVFSSEAGAPFTPAHDREAHHMARTHIQESKLSTPAHTPHRDRDHHRSHSHGDSATKARPVFHSGTGWLGSPSGGERSPHHHHHHQQQQAAHWAPDSPRPSEQRPNSAGTGTQSGAESDEDEDEDEDSFRVQTFKKGLAGTPAAFGGGDAFSQFAHQEPQDPAPSPVLKRGRMEESEHSHKERGVYKMSKANGAGARTGSSPSAVPVELPQSHRSKQATRHHRHQEDNFVDLT